MNGGRAWKTYSTVALLVITLTSSFSAVLALGVQAGPLMSLDGFGLAEAHDRRAFEILERNPSLADLSFAEREAAVAIRLAPYNNAARLRLVYIQGRTKRLDTNAIKWIADSYSLVPLDHTVGAWRVGYALERWDQLPPDLRNAVHREALTFGRVGSRDVDVRKVLASVRNPEGKLAATLWLRELTH